MSSDLFDAIRSVNSIKVKTILSNSDINDCINSIDIVRNESVLMAALKKPYESIVLEILNCRKLKLKSQILNDISKTETILTLALKNKFNPKVVQKLLELIKSESDSMNDIDLLKLLITPSPSSDQTPIQLCIKEEALKCAIYMAEIGGEEVWTSISSAIPLMIERQRGDFLVLAFAYPEWTNILEKVSNLKNSPFFKQLTANWSQEIWERFFRRICLSFKDFVIDEQRGATIFSALFYHLIVPNISSFSSKSGQIFEDYIRWVPKVGAPNFTQLTTDVLSHFVALENRRARQYLTVRLNPSLSLLKSLLNPLQSSKDLYWMLAGCVIGAPTRESDEILGWLLDQILAQVNQSGAVIEPVKVATLVLCLTDDTRATKSNQRSLKSIAGQYVLDQKTAYSPQSLTQDLIDSLADPLNYEFVYNVRLRSWEKKFSDSAATIDVIERKLSLVEQKLGNSLSKYLSKSSGVLADALSRSQWILGSVQVPLLLKSLVYRQSLDLKVLKSAIEEKSLYGFFSNYFLNSGHLSALTNEPLIQLIPRNLIEDQEWLSEIMFAISGNCKVSAQEAAEAWRSLFAWQNVNEEALAEIHEFASELIEEIEDDADNISPLLLAALKESFNQV